MFDIVGLGNALVDIEILLTEEELLSLEVVKNSMTLISLEEREVILKKLEDKSKKFSSGGAVCNSLCGIAKKSLGEFKVGMMGFVGKDFHGDKYLEDLKKVGVDFLGKKLDGKTGTCLVLVTPDGNRTMLTTLGCASQLDDEVLATLNNKDENIETKYFIAESYLLFGEENINKIKTIFKFFKNTETKTILSDSDAFCVEQEGAIYKELFNQVDVFFSNGEQAKAMMGLSREDETSVKTIATEWSNMPVVSMGNTEDGSHANSRAPMLVVTDGANGAYLIKDKPLHVPAVATKVVDTTGAGDAFCAGVLSGYLNNLSLAEMGRLGAEMASKVVSHYGARW